MERLLLVYCLKFAPILYKMVLSLHFKAVTSHYFLAYPCWRLVIRSNDKIPDSLRASVLCTSLCLGASLNSGRPLTNQPLLFPSLWPTGSCPHPPVQTRPETSAAYFETMAHCESYIHQHAQLAEWICGVKRKAARLEGRDQLWIRFKKG